MAKTNTKAIEGAATTLAFGDLKDIKEVYNSHLSAVNSSMDYINNGYSRDMRIAASMDDPEEAATYIKIAEEKLKTAKKEMKEFEPTLPILIAAVRMKTQDLTQSQSNE